VPQGLDSVAVLPLRLPFSVTGVPRRFYTAWVELRLSMIRPSSGQLLPFGVAAEIFRERPFAPAHRGSGGGGMRGGGTKAARRSISSKGVRNSARSPAGLGLVLW